MGSRRRYQQRRGEERMALRATPIDRRVAEEICEIADALAACPPEGRVELLLQHCVRLDEQLLQRRPASDVRVLERTRRLVGDMLRAEEARRAAA